MGSDFYPEGVASVTKDENTYLINKEGERISQNFIGIMRFQEGVAGAVTKNWLNVFIDRFGNKIF